MPAVGCVSPLPSLVLPETSETFDAEVDVTAPGPVTSPVNCGSVPGLGATAGAELEGLGLVAGEVTDGPPEETGSDEFDADPPGLTVVDAAHEAEHSGAGSGFCFSEAHPARTHDNTKLTLKDRLTTKTPRENGYGEWDYFRESESASAEPHSRVMPKVVDWIDVLANRVRGPPSCVQLYTSSVRK